MLYIKSVGKFVHKNSFCDCLIPVYWSVYRIEAGAYAESCFVVRFKCIYVDRRGEINYRQHYTSFNVQLLSVYTELTRVMPSGNRPTLLPQILLPIL